ncbi:MAG: glycoside hydrolase family protein [Prolixibacteraceae bacterium]
MKKIFSVLFLVAMLFWACDDKFAEGEFQFYNIEEPQGNGTLPGIPEIGKKGAAFTTNGTQWSYKVSDLKAHWHYSWGSTLSEYEPANVDFVPMIWGYNGINPEKVAELKALKEEGKIRYLLGFNEPDGEKQANMTVDQAIEKWPMLEEVGVPLGSPAPVNPAGEWLQEFMQRAETEGLRVDFVCVHWYGGTNVQGLLNKLEEVYNLYGKPIWITEFAPADWDANTPAENRHSTEEVLTFMENALPELENLNYVDRYAWFSFSQNRAAGTSSALFDAEGNLTELGTYYANFDPNIYIGDGKAPEVDPAIVFQDNFEDYASGSDLTDQGYIVWEGSASVVSGDAFEGQHFGQSDASKNNFALRRPITLEAGKTYSIEIATKMQDGAKHTLQVHPRDEYEYAWVECLNSDWQINSTEITITEGNEEVIIALYRWPKKVLSFDNIVIRELE